MRRHPLPKLRPGHCLLLIGVLIFNMGQGAECECECTDFLNLAAQQSQVDVFGVCCLLGGECQENVTIGDCFSGANFFPNATCADVDCLAGTLLGACCQSDGTCTQELADVACSGQFLGSGVSCDECGEGTTDVTEFACCLMDGSCVSDTREGCLDRGGEVQGATIVCDTANCSASVSDESGCCLPDGSTCENRTQADCEQAGGVFQTQLCANVTDCAVFVDGACCDGASCSEFSKSVCDALGRTFKGGGTECATTACP